MKAGPHLMALPLALCLAFAPAPLPRAEHRPGPAWPAGRTLYHERAGATVAFHLGGACLVECNGVLFWGRWWRDGYDPDQAVVAHGADWDGRPFYHRFRRQFRP
jgi:hypothetical protein